MHDILYHRHHIENYDHLEFPGVVPRTFIGALLVSILASPMVLAINLLHLPKFYSLLAVRLALGFFILATLRFLRIQIRDKFGPQVEAFFVILFAIQFHMLFYCTRPLPNILALGLVNLSYGYWLKGSYYATLRFQIFATIVFRCDMLLLLCPLGLGLLLTKSISIWKAIKCCAGAVLFSIGLTILVDSIMWQKLLWPEFNVFWFNSVLNRSSEWGTQPFYWYFTSALPRALLVAYPLFMFGVILDRRIVFYVLPVLSFVILYSKLPHKELRFIISSVPIFNLAAAVAASRMYVSSLFVNRYPFWYLLCSIVFFYRYNNRKKSFWNLLYIGLLGSLVISLGCTVVTFMASFENYPSGYALKTLHRVGDIKNTTSEIWVHIDTFSAMNGISWFCENDNRWRYSKEEDIPLENIWQQNFTYLLNEHLSINGYKCLFKEDGFSRIRLKVGFPPISMVKRPKVYVHGNLENTDIMHRVWPGCS
ncbi:dol-P-Man:Man(7)GlcNAc(2)-PP-Dol alpha-1,6-mannosyltransferase-like isoform X2 [Bidens hawaiensis]|uniref:dol-P-Man:Man(7)GlcNAc(2)-PP-Dol alpha-1,6-mannosyltransferase-like isoform X2 n=1 Tax=Bidens hawaiensis TaxID=980011 RepID=UPI00404B3BC5